jgi:hypothetical protein
MTKEQVISEIDKAFGGIGRPEMFIRGTCRCEECLEHEAEMQAFNPGDLDPDKLDNPGWDPICFASNRALGYLMPGLVRLVLDHTERYVDQFVFHVEQPERLAAFSPRQARALICVLDFLVLNEAGALDGGFVADAVFRAREILAKTAEDDRAPGRVTGE